MTNARNRAQENILDSLNYGAFKSPASIMKDIDAAHRVVNSTRTEEKIIPLEEIV